MWFTKKDRGLQPRLKHWVAPGRCAKCPRQIFKELFFSRLALLLSHILWRIENRTLFVEGTEAICIKINAGIWEESNYSCNKLHSLLWMIKTAYKHQNKVKYINIYKGGLFPKMRVFSPLCLNYLVNQILYLTMARIYLFGTEILSFPINSKAKEGQPLLCYGSVYSILYQEQCLTFFICCHIYS